MRYITVESPKSDAVKFNHNKFIFRPKLITIESKKMYVYNKVRLRRIPKRHQPVGWHLHEFQNLFVYLFKLRSYKQKFSSNITKKTKRKKIFVLVLSNKQNKMSKNTITKAWKFTITYLKNVRCHKYVCLLLGKNESNNNFIGRS